MMHSREPGSIWLRETGGVAAAPGRGGGFCCWKVQSLEGLLSLSLAYRQDGDCLEPATQADGTNNASRPSSTMLSL